MQKTQDVFVALRIPGAPRYALQGGQNGQKLEFGAINPLQLGFSLSKSAHLGCYGHLDIMNKVMQKTSGLFVALRIFGALRGPKMAKNLFYKSLKFYFKEAYIYN